MDVFLYFFLVIVDRIMGSDHAAGESAQRYAARMVYLSEEDDAAVFGGAAPEPMGRTLKPPVLFMSRRQARADSALCAVRIRERSTLDELTTYSSRSGAIITSLVLGESVTCWLLCDKDAAV